MIALFYCCTLDLQNLFILRNKLSSLFLDQHSIPTSTHPLATTTLLFTPMSLTILIRL